MINSNGSVWAVVVTYQPDLETLAVLLRAMVQQVDGIVVVDNGSGASALAWLAAYHTEVPFIVIPLLDNKGIALAQNVGINRAKVEGASYVILSDQDSEPAPDMVEKLKLVAEKQLAANVPLGAVAPIYKDAEDGLLSGFVQVGFFGFKRIGCEESNRVVEADFLIASGSLIPMATIDVVGGMDDELFIDHVDTEWCFRAKSQGYRLFGACNARMLHSLGDKRSKFWFLRWRTIPHHSPFRYYYIFRNSTLLQSRSYMPFFWKLADFGRCLRAMAYFGIFSPVRFACLGMMYRGFRDGLAGRVGKMP